MPVFWSSPPLHESAPHLIDEKLIVFLNAFLLNRTNSLLSFFDTHWITSDELSKKKRRKYTFLLFDLRYRERGKDHDIDFHMAHTSPQVKSV